MNVNPKSLFVAAGIAAVSLSVIGCHGNVPGSGGYVPASTSSSVAFSQPSPDNSKKKKDEIKSNCGHSLHIVIAALVNCKFRESGYGSGTFTVANDTKGIVLVTPSSGTESTPFTIVGLVVGSGKLIWSDSKGHKFPIRVKVTL